MPFLGSPSSAFFYKPDLGHFHLSPFVNLEESFIAHHIKTEIFLIQIFLLISRNLFFRRIVTLLMAFFSNFLF